MDYIWNHALLYYNCKNLLLISKVSFSGSLETVDNTNSWWVNFEFQSLSYKLFYLTSISRLHRQKSSIIFESNILCANTKFRKQTIPNVVIFPKLRFFVFNISFPKYRSSCFRTIEFKTIMYHKMSAYNLFF